MGRGACVGADGGAFHSCYMHTDTGGWGSLGRERQLDPYKAPARARRASEVRVSYPVETYIEITKGRHKGKQGIIHAIMYGHEGLDGFGGPGYEVRLSAKTVAVP